MTGITHKDNLISLSENLKSELCRRFLSDLIIVTPTQLAKELNIKYSEALALLADLEARGICEMKLLIYHNCQPEIPVDAIPYGIGWPNLPWVCPHCGSIVESYDELSFDLMAKSKQPIEFV